jgi:alpha-tubulin suppressor-like RCC1 family protein
MLFSYGQLGNNDTKVYKSYVPVAVATHGILSGKNVIQVAGGGYHSLVLTLDGGVYSFGWNS